MTETKTIGAFSHPSKMAAKSLAYFFWTITGLLSLAAASCWGQSFNVTATVNAQNVIKTIPRELYGTNVEWFYNGNTILDERTGANRPEIVTAAKNLAPSVIRFPGGALADHYHWRDGVGRYANRPNAPHGMDAGFSRALFGTHELMSLAKAAGAKVTLQTNVITGSPEEAAAWVAYCNAATHPERSANGSAAPFNVRDWEIGNEQYMDPSGAYAPHAHIPVDEYLAKLARFVPAMKAVDPQIRTGAVTGINYGRYHFVKNDNWNRTLLTQGAQYIDYLAVHNAYAPIVIPDLGASYDDVYYSMLASPALVANNLAQLNKEIETYAPAHASRIKIAVTEWGPFFHLSGQSRWLAHPKTMGSGVFTASMLRTFLLADRVEMANFFKLIEPSFMGSMNMSGVPKPSYLVLQLFSTNLAPNLVSSEAKGPTFNSGGVGVVDEVTDVPYLDILSSKSADGNRITVLLINKHLTAGAMTSLRLNGFVPGPQYVRRELSAKSSDANNGQDFINFANVYIAPQATAPHGSQFYAGAPGTVMTKVSKVNVPANSTYTVPAASVVLLEFYKQGVRIP